MAIQVLILNDVGRNYHELELHAAVVYGMSIFGLEFSGNIDSTWCCYITVDSTTTALQNGACTYRCISKQMHYKTLLSPNGYMKSLEIYENYITLSCLEKYKLFYNIILT
jgi:hypothetical protein